MSLDFSVSMAICTIGSLFMLLGQWDTTAKRSEESEGQLGESLRVPLFIMEPSNPRTPKTLPAGTSFTATISRPMRMNLRWRRAQDGTAARGGR